MKIQIATFLVSILSQGAFAGSHSISGGTTSDPGYTTQYKCETSGYYLKSNRSGGKWPEVSMGSIADSAKIQDGSEHVTCQYKSWKDSECLVSGYEQKNTDAFGKDICVPSGVFGTTNPRTSTAPTSPSGYDDRYRVVAGEDQVFFFQKPKLK